jgi:hypothetical protein
MAVNVDFNQALFDPYGTVIMQRNRLAEGKPEAELTPADLEPMRLGAVAVRALTAAHQGDKRDDEQKVRDWQLAQRIVAHDNGDRAYRQLRLDGREAVHLQELIGKLFPAPVICAQAALILEGEDEPADPSTPEQG